MKRFLKIAGIGVGALVALLLVAVGAVYGITQMKMGAKLEVAGHQLTVNSDSATLERGRHIIYSFAMCADCHGTDLGGFPMIEEPIVARLYGANLTAGEGGVGGTLTDLDWERAIRHGVAKDGRKLLYMPAHEYALLHDDDMAAVIAYLNQLPPVNRTNPPNTVGPIARALLLGGQFKLLRADLMDHNAAHTAVIAEAPTAEYGKYLSVACAGCHGQNFSGGPMPGAPPEWTPPSNLTPTGIGHYTEENFFALLREGRRPAGTMADTVQMPVRLTKNLNDNEIRALWAYLKTVPPKEYATK
ncbi:MAG: c-type cytochrome [Gemmatimonadetes bacterium]|nr:c-type cytochrome [Gemmatimonadota bacterium]